MIEGMMRDEGKCREGDEVNEDCDFEIGMFTNKSCTSNVSSTAHNN